MDITINTNGTIKAIQRKILIVFGVNPDIHMIVWSPRLIYFRKSSIRVSTLMLRFRYQVKEYFIELRNSIRRIRRQ